MNAFIADLIDHKERVTKYMQVVADILVERNLNYKPPKNELGDKDTLIDLVALVSSHYRRKTAEVTATLQLGAIFVNTTRYFMQSCHKYNLIACVISDIFHRAAVHDNSKFGPEEFDLFNQAFPVLAQHAYGSDGYKAGLQLLGPALKHHYSVNDHHPEFFEHGVADMHAVQQIEMCCDWCAASDRSQTPIEEGLKKNKVRFGIDDSLFPILKNTIVALKEAK
jgi:hypothetical protein